jgi:hypothetical protein
MLELPFGVEAKGSRWSNSPSAWFKTEAEARACAAQWSKDAFHADVYDLSAWTPANLQESKHIARYVRGEER